jgi:hypothetical protein
MGHGVEGACSPEVGCRFGGTSGPGRVARGARLRASGGATGPCRGGDVGTTALRPRRRKRACLPGPRSACGPPPGCRRGEQRGSADHSERRPQLSTHPKGVRFSSLSRSGLTPLGGRMVIAWTRATHSRGSDLYCPPISEKCVARLATQFLPAGSRKAFEMTVQRHAGTDTGSRAPVGKGSCGGTGRAPPLLRWRDRRSRRASRTGPPWSPQRPGRRPGRATDARGRGRVTMSGHLKRRQFARSASG